MIESRNYSGTRDWLGKDAKKRKKIIDVVSSVLEIYGFEPLETPIIELASVLRGKYGDEGNQLTYFFSKGSSELGLRYDQTVPLARVAAQYPDLVIPYRRYTVGPVFRADKPQAGRYRQFTQIDFDIVGISNRIADAEVCAINYSVLLGLGFKDFQIQVCDRQLLDAMAKCLGVKTKDQIIAVLRSWDKIEKTEMDQIVQELTVMEIEEKVIDNFKSITKSLLALKGSNKDILEGVAAVFKNDEVNIEIKKLDQLCQYIIDFGVPEKYFRVNPCLARGLSYYTGPIFETVAGKGIGSITGGGRYDKLILDLGGPDLPATGSSFGLERVLSVMEDLSLFGEEDSRIEVFVTVFDPKSEESVKTSINILRLIRAGGLKAEMYMGEQKLSKQFKLADRRGTEVVLVIGPDEIKKKLVVAKILKEASGGKESKENQIYIRTSKLVEKLKEILGKYHNCSTY